MKKRKIIFMVVQMIALLVCTSVAHTEIGKPACQTIYRDSEEKTALKETFVSIDTNDKELQAAEKTLIDFFNYLHDGQYDKAVPLFEPCEEGVGLQRSSWEGILSVLPPEERNNKGKALGAYYRSVGVPIKANVCAIKRIADNIFKLKIQFLKDDGSIYVYGSCCNATEKEIQSEIQEFDYFIQRVNGVYKVRTPPLFRP
jgi:hypothetical protein